MTSSKDLSLGKKILFSLIPLIIVLMILEVAGRIVYPFDVEKRAETKLERDPRRALPYVDDKVLRDVHAKKQQYLPFLGWIGYPGWKSETISINEMGLRDSPIEPRKPGEYRVLMTGGSAAWGFGASGNEHTPSAVLEQRLNARAPEGVSYRVINAAYPAWASRQELFLFIEFMRLLDPDMVLTLTGFNDVNIMTQGTTGQMHIRPESNDLAKAVEAHLQPMDTGTALRKLLGSSGIWRLVVYFREVAAHQRKTTQKNQKHYEYKPGVTHSAIELITERYRIMAETARRHGIDMVLALQPTIYSTKKQMNSDEAGVLESTRERFPGFEETYSRNFAEFTASVEGLSAEGVDVVDLSSALDDEPAPLFIDPAHTVDRGYELVGEALVAPVEAAAARKRAEAAPAASATTAAP